MPLWHRLAGHKPALIVTLLAVALVEVALWSVLAHRPGGGRVWLAIHAVVLAVVVLVAWLRARSRRRVARHGRSRSARSGGLGQRSRLGGLFRRRGGAGRQRSGLGLGRLFGGRSGGGQRGRFGLPRFGGGRSSAARSGGGLFGRTGRSAGSAGRGSRLGGLFGRRAAAGGTRAGGLAPRTGARAAGSGAAQSRPGRARRWWRDNVRAAKKAAADPPAKKTTGPAAKATEPAKKTAEPAKGGPATTKKEEATVSQPTPTPRPTGQAGPPRAAAPTGGDDPSAGLHQDDISLQGWGARLHKYPQAINEHLTHQRRVTQDTHGMARAMRRLAQQSDSDLPADKALVSEIERQAAALEKNAAAREALDKELASIQGEAEGLPHLYRGRHDADEERARNPRGGIKVESRADAAAAARDI